MSRRAIDSRATCSTRPARSRDLARPRQRLAEPGSAGRERRAARGVRVAILGGTGSFGRAMAARLVALGEDEVVIGSRAGERAQANPPQARGGATGAPD